MKTTKKTCNLVPCLYIVQYMICVCGGEPTSIFFQGAPNPLATALTVSIIVVRMKDISSVFKVSGNEWLLYLLIGSALAYI